MALCGNCLLAQTIDHQPHSYHLELAKSNNIIIVDMGSTGTRMYAYQVSRALEKPKNGLPKITEIATAHNHDKNAVAKFSQNPEKIDTHISPIYQELRDKLNVLKIDIRQTPIYMYATAGMRLKTEQEQRAIYNQLELSLRKIGHKDAITIETIPGALEGIFDWLSVNYKHNTLKNNKPTIAALDMGGASTQVALEYSYNPSDISKIDIKDIYTLKFAKNTYHIYSKSILGYGLESTRKNIQHDYKDHIASQCNIFNNQHWNFDSNNTTKTQDNQKITLAQSKDNHKFNYHSCTKLIKSYLNKKQEHLSIAKTLKKALKKEMTLVAFSGYYYKFNLFNSQSPKDLIKSIPDRCHDNRTEFKKELSHQTEHELNETCFDATYLKTLLNTGYEIPVNYKNFIIPNEDIDWTLGAAIFISTDQKWPQ